jgi:DNA polymerase-3 subunit epsilon
MKYLFLDLETTGTDRIKNNIWQIAGLITDGRDTGYKALDAFDFKFRPYPGMVELEALEKGRMTLEDLSAFPLSAEEVYQKFLKILAKHCNKFDKTDKLQIVAYNAGFDSEFLREFFTKSGDKFYGSWFWTPAICVMQAAANELAEHRAKLPNFQLKTLCLAAEIAWDDDKAHDAKYDIAKTFELFRHLTPKS